MAPGQGAASWAPSPGSRADVARAGGLADGRGNEGSIVEQQQQMATQGGRSGGADGARSCTSWPELQAGFRADVARADVGAQHLCSSSGTNRSAGDVGCAGSIESRQQQDEVVGGGSEGAGTASCFPDSELQVESRADVAQADATVGDGNSRGLMGSEQQQGGVTCRGDNGRADRGGMLLFGARAPSRVSGRCGSGECDG